MSLLSLLYFNYDHGDPTDEEQYMLELINRARADPAAEAARLKIDLNEGLDPGTIDASPKQPLAFNKFLIKAARAHTQWMLDNDEIGHYEGNVSPGAQIEKAGYKGEFVESQNCAGVFYSGNLGQDAKSSNENLFVDEDVPSRGHRKAMLRDLKEVGIGIKAGDFKGKKFTLSTQDYCQTIIPVSSAFLVGVVYKSSSSAEGYAPGLGVGGCGVTLSEGGVAAVTSSSGGYAIPLDKIDGPLTIKFTLGFWKSEQKVEVKNSTNLKVDWKLPWTLTVIVGILRLLSLGITFTKKSSNK